MNSAEAKNLEAIHRAIVQHNGNCEGNLTAIRMNPHEVERLGWDEILGIPVKPDPDQGTGSFELVCDLENPPVGEALTDADAGEDVPITVGPGAVFARDPRDGNEWTRVGTTCRR